jgi:AcrR family transcriptional regulator
MCPAPAKTSDDEVVLAARALLEHAGTSSLSMQAVARAVGVRAPSLYKRFADRERLLDAVARAGIADLAAALRSATERAPAGEEVLAMARTYRNFARRSPRLYALIYNERDGSADLHAARVQAVEPLLGLLRDWVGEADSLPAARLLTAFLHGFVSMETSGNFRLGGDVQRAFDFGVERIVRALGERAPQPRRAGRAAPAGANKRRMPASSEFR